MPTNTKALQVAEPAGIVAGKNAVINGGFDIWQRGTSFANPNSTSAYTADRWISLSGASGYTFSRQLSGLTGIQYCMRAGRDSGSTSSNNIWMLYGLESADSYRFAGQTVTLSFYARKGANMSQASSLLTTRLFWGTGTDQNAASGFTGSVTVVDQNITLTTSWQRFTFTASIPSTSTQVGFGTFYLPSGTAGAADYYEITGVQLELGNTATPFSRAGGTIQGELAACQRYYWRITSPNQANTRHTVFAPAASTTVIRMNIPNPVPMRVAPTTVDYASLIDYDNSATGNAITPTIDPNSNSTVSTLTLTSSGLTQYRNYCALGNSTTSYLGLGAEL